MRVLLTIALVLAAALVSLQGCGKSGGSSSSADEAREGVQRVVYTVRGRVTSLPDPAKPAAEFMVFHEEVPAFRNPDGSLGMRSMNMAFPLAPGVALESVAVGDKVEITFEVEYDEASGRLLESRTTKVVELPAETALDLPG